MVGSYPITIKVAPKMDAQITVQVMDEAEAPASETPAESVAE
jgi:hypothetical protein